MPMRIYVNLLSRSAPPITSNYEDVFSREIEQRRVLAPEQFHSLLPLIREAYRTMVLVAGCLACGSARLSHCGGAISISPGSRCSYRRSVVHGRVGDVKTEYSRDSVPFDTAVVKALMLHTGNGRSRHKRAGCLPIRSKEAVPPGGDSEKAHPHGWCRGRDRRRYRLAHVPAQLSVVAGRNRGAAHRPKGVDAPRQHSDHDEHLRKGHDGQ